jgi:hypothetical protein
VLEFNVSASSTRRGMPLKLTGSARAGDDACAFARVDIALSPEEGEAIAIGSLPTDASGKFSGAVTVPLGVDVGHYMLTVSTPGTARCGPSQD